MSFLGVMREFFDKYGIEVYLVKLIGSVEVMIVLGIVDVIVDFVEMGSILVVNWF